MKAKPSTCFVVAVLLFLPSCGNKNGDPPSLHRGKPSNARIAALAALSPVNKGIVMLGDSISSAQDLSDLFGRPIHNRGVGGFTTNDAVNNLNSLFRGTPEKVFILLGANDALHNVGPIQFATNYRTLLTIIKKRSPASQIYVLSILPTSFPVANNSVFIFNNALKKISSTFNITYIDIHSHFLKGKLINPAFTVDGIHLSSSGYASLRNLLRMYM
jgi:lysophospholipase L1-like esterase